MKGPFDRRVRGIVVKRGLLPEARAAEAEELSSREQKPYCDVLLDHGFVSEPDLVAAVALEANLAAIDVEQVVPSDAARATLDWNLAAYYGVLPVQREGALLTLAVANPFDTSMLNDVHIITECELRPVVSSERAIRRAVERAYARAADGTPAAAAGKAVPEAEPEEQVPADAVSAAENGGDSPVIKLVNMILGQALRDGASHVHLEPYERSVRARFRQDGALAVRFSPPKKMHGATTVEEVLRRTPQERSTPVGPR